MVQTNFKIEGAKEMQNLLRELGPRTANKVALPALRAGAKPILKEAKRLVAKDTRKLEKGIKTKAGKQRSGDDTRSLIIGLSGEHRRIGHLIEFGTSKMAARPFLRPALDSNISQALDDMGRVLGAGIEREALKLAKK